jgi:hypothetical protein
MQNKTIWILWLQGWENAPWLQQRVAESWIKNNPDWSIKLINEDQAYILLPDIEYMYDTSKTITPQAKSDIIRLSLLAKYGGVWADATMLCMQPLNNWYLNAIKPAGFWMYHGEGEGAALPIEEGPASWFILSEPNNRFICEWKKECDNYWLSRTETDEYFWMDILFKKIIYSDIYLFDLWLSVPFLSCEAEGQSHCLFKGSKMTIDDEEIKKLLFNNPPYALKLWNSWNTTFPDATTNECLESTGYFAIQISTRFVET